MPSGRTRAMTSSRVRFEKRAVKMPSFIRFSGLDREFLQVIGADASAFKRGPVPIVLLDVVMFDASLGCRLENTLPVDDAGTDFRKRISFRRGSSRLVTR